MDLEDLAELARKLIAYPTTSGREGLLLSPLTEALERCGLEVSRQPVPGHGENLIASRGEGGPWLVTHLDVYPPYEHPQPFTPRLQGELLIGRGAVDTKGQIAALLWALAHSRGPVQVALVVDEEETGAGSAALEVPPGIGGAVVLEPTSLRLAVAEAGSASATVIVPGREAHGSTPWRGRSAIELAWELYRRFLGSPLFSHRHPLFERGAWVNLGRIEGGYDGMLVPSRCRLELEVGFAPGIGASEAAAELRASFSRACSIAITELDEPWEISPDAPIATALARALEEAGAGVQLWGMPSWTDAANLVGKGVPAVVVGAGDLAVAHSFREALPLGELETLARALAWLIDHPPEEGGAAS